MIAEVRVDSATVQSVHRMAGTRNGMRVRVSRSGTGMCRLRASTRSGSAVRTPTRNVRCGLLGTITARAMRTVTTISSPANPAPAPVSGFASGSTASVQVETMRKTSAAWSTATERRPVRRRSHVAM